MYILNAASKKKKKIIFCQSIYVQTHFSHGTGNKTFPPWNTKCFTNAQVEDFGSEQTRVLKPFNH